MEVLYPRCCGLDLHKATIAACALVAEGKSKKRNLLRCRTMTRDLLALADWLDEWGVTHVAMESTGVYWKPVWNILDGRFELILVNAQHFKAVPGRKTDMRDCEWLAELLQHGLVRGSFVPPTPIRDLRDLNRNRAILAQERATVSNRIEKVLEDANIKLSSVASHVLGQSGRTMLQAIAAGEEDIDKLAGMAKAKLRKKGSAQESDRPPVLLDFCEVPLFASHAVVGHPEPAGASADSGFRGIPGFRTAPRVTQQPVKTTRSATSRAGNTCFPVTVVSPWQKTRDRTHQRSPLKQGKPTQPS
jgi:transposase